MARTAVVIGSNCFTGSHVVDALLDEPGVRVEAVSRSPEKGPVFLPYLAREDARARVRFHQLDLVRESAQLVHLLDEVEPEVVINVAALSEVNLSNFQPVEYFETNTLGVVRLASKLRTRAYLHRYVHISSAEVYGRCAVPIDEDAPLAPSTPYAASKAAADMYLLTLRRNFGFPATLVRSTNVYGRHQQLYKIIPRTAIYMKLGRKVRLEGGGRAVKSFVHIRDVADGVVRILAAPDPAPIYHFSSTSTETVADVVGLVCRLMGHDPAAATEVVGDRVGQDARYWLDWSRARAELGWTPGVDLEAGTKEVIAWVEEHWDAIRAEPLEYVHRV